MPTPLSEPSVILKNRYRLNHVIGKGGMGIVYHATDLERDQMSCAVKLLKDSQQTEKIKRRFEEEIRLISTLKSPHIVKVYDVGTFEPNHQFVVMELLKGAPLSDLLKSKEPLGAERGLHIALGIASALEVAHDAGVVHRDLKPANIFVDPTDQGDVIKILDFGIAKDLNREHQLNLTKTGMLIGTPTYMAPESFDDHQVLSTVSDLYAVGLLLYQMIIGRLPFYPHHPKLPDMMKRMPPPLQVCWQHLNLTPLPLRGVPDEINALVLDLLKKKPADRIQSSQELIKKIEYILRLHFQQNYSSATELLPQNLFKQWLDEQPTSTKIEESSSAKTKLNSSADSLSLSAPLDPCLDHQISESSLYNTSALKPIRPIQPLSLKSSPASMAARHDLPLLASPLPPPLPPFPPLPPLPPSVPPSVPPPPLALHQPPDVRVDQASPSSTEVSAQRSTLSSDHIKTIPMDASLQLTPDILSAFTEDHLSSTLALKPSEMKALNAELEKMLTQRTRHDLTEASSPTDSPTEMPVSSPQKSIHERSTLGISQQRFDQIDLSPDRSNTSPPQEQVDYNSTPIDLSSEGRRRQKELFFGLIALLTSMGIIYFLLTYFAFYFK